MFAPALFSPTLAGLLLAIPPAPPTVSTENPREIRPAGPPPAWAPSLDPQMHAVLEQYAAFGAPDPTTLTAFQLRNAPLPGDAVNALLKKTGLPPAEPKVDVSHQVLPVGPDDGLLARVYTPKSGSGPRPVGGVLSWRGLGDRGPRRL